MISPPLSRKHTTMAVQSTREGLRYNTSQSQLNLRKTLQTNIVVKVALSMELFLSTAFHVLSGEMATGPFLRFTTPFLRTWASTSQFGNTQSTLSTKARMQGPYPT